MYDSYPRANLFGTHVRKLASSIVEQEYEISVWLPPGYDESPETKYPVLYVLDADVLFGVAAHMGWMLIAGGDVPPMIIVGIGWHIQSFDDWSVKRSRDFTPVAMDMLPGSMEGGAANFLSFIETELLPLINANYRTDPSNQNIWGHSGGGFFVLYALLQKPKLFRGIVAGSPAIWSWSSGMTEIEKAFAESGKPLPVQVYMAFGALEGDWVKPAEEFYNTLLSRNYGGLVLKYELLDDETHTSVMAPLFITGLRAILKA